MKKKLIIIPSIIILLLAGSFLYTINKYKKLSSEANLLLLKANLLGNLLSVQVIPDPVDDDVFYFSSNAAYSDIRKYDFKKDKDFSFEEKYINLSVADNIFSEVAEESFMGTNDIHLLGFDNEKLVFWNHVSGDSPGPCADPWIDRADNLFYIIPNEFKDDLLKKNKYTLEESEKQKRLDEQKECIKNI